MNGRSENLPQSQLVHKQSLQTPRPLPTTVRRRFTGLPLKSHTKNINGNTEEGWGETLGRGPDAKKTQGARRSLEAKFASELVDRSQVITTTLPEGFVGNWKTSTQVLQGWLACWKR
mmetsp:Transcript_24660/g.37477  ORF Transcript_24660/g.37477 Transcript_24660/m.37477 type:complete len:117 (+) Transcript_24660:90-440(+)